MSARRALLLTDVVDSTAISERLGDAAAATLWRAHDRTARDLLPAWRGREIDKTDGMLVVFETVPDALGFAVEYNQAIRTLPVPLSSRSCIHFAEVVLRENSPDDIALGAKPLEVDGIAKPIAARIMSLAAGGQILLTAEARAAVASDDHPFESHGFWAVKGIAEPLEVFGVATPGEPVAPPSDSEKAYRVIRDGDHWVPVRAVPHNLPQLLTSFLGRESERAELKALLARARLVTLLGMGGMGKTRLSLQVAAELMHEFPHGVWFIDLAPLRDTALVAGETARVLGIKEERGRPLVATVCSHLHDQRILLILDNCEHLVEPAAALAHAVLRAAPGVRVLASSRESLRIPGEQTYPVMPLAVPTHHADVEELQRSAAVRLFVDRARQHRPSFELTRQNALLVARMVQRLEGIPLAIELAAARMKSMTLADVDARLHDRFRLLTGGGTVLDERQQTLRALVDWSYALLDPGEQLVLARLSVFRGGFDLEAAERVCGAEPLAPGDVLDILGSLVEKSLVILTDREDLARYSVLETIRDYGAEKLAARGDFTSTAALHCAHFFALAKAARDGLSGLDQGPWLRRLETEQDNIRAALGRAVKEVVDPVIAVKMAVALQGFWILRGYLSEGRQLVESTLAIPAIRQSPLAQGHALYVGAALAVSQGDYHAGRRMLEACLALRRPLGNPVDIAATLSTLSMARLALGDVDGARAAEEEALPIFRAAGNRVGEAIGLLHLGQSARGADDEAAALGYLRDCLALARALQNQELQGECEWQLGEMALETGDLALAGSHIERALTICRSAADKRGEALAMRSLGRVRLRATDLVGARDSLTRALSTFRGFAMHDDVVLALIDLSILLAAEGQSVLSVELAAAAAAAWDRLGLRRLPSDERRWTAHLHSLRSSLATADFESAWQEGRVRDLEQALAKAGFGTASTPSSVT